MGRFVIDGDGKVWAADDDRLLEAMGYPDPDFEIISYAVRNLGAVAVDVGDDSITVTFRALTASANALNAAARFLSDLPPLPVSVRTESADWSERRFVSGTEALAWLATQRPRARNVVIEPRQLTSLSNRQLNRLEMTEDFFALLFKKWRIASGHMPNDLPEFLVRFGLHERAAIARKRADGQLVFDHVGGKIDLYKSYYNDGSWPYRMQGLPVAAQPDREYGSYTESVFRRAIEVKQPAFDHINAIVSDSSGATQFNYDRLLLPWKCGDAEVLTCLSYKTAPDKRLSAD